MASLREYNSSTKDCLTYNLSERSNTPPNISKYRKSTYLEPGKRFQHHGVTEDYNHMNLDNKIYGIRSEKGNGTASDVLKPKQFNEADRLNTIKAERIYKSSIQEPLGKKMERNIIFPKKFTEGNQAFGIKSKSSLEPAKDLIFPNLSDDYFEGEDLYKRSHHSYLPGEQMKRNYEWKINPNDTVFGRKGDTIALNGVSSNITLVLQGNENDYQLISNKSVEDFRNTSDMIGMSRNLGQGSGIRPFDMVYGKSSAAMRKAKKVHTAAEVMRGNYSLDEQLPDKDLEKSITPGFRNISFENRAYGIPSIRSDLQSKSNSKSLANSQNFGDDLIARDLIHPPAFSDLSLTPDDLNELRTKEKLLNIFNKIGYDYIDSKITDKIFELASNGLSKASINKYRNVLNDYLDYVETGNEIEWLQLYGI